MTHPILRSRSRGRWTVLRGGFTVAETVVALALLAVAMALVAELGLWSMRERARNASRQAAVELAGNILEAARASPPEALTPDWAAGQQIPEELRILLPDGKLSVRVEPEKMLPQARRVTVEVSWKPNARDTALTVQLTGLFCPRSAAPGGKP